MKILNLGSLNIDKTYSVKRFVQPKETIQALDYEEFCGGKGLNQSVALARAGAEVYHAGAVGGDGKLLLDMLKEAGADTGYVETLDGASGHAVIQIDESGQNNIIICGGTNRKITREYISSVLDHFGKGDLILLQNEVSNIVFAMEEAKKRGESIYDLTNRWVEGIPPEELKVIFLPFLNGSAEDAQARGTFVGLTEFDGKAHMLRAVYEGIVFSHVTHVKKLLRNRPAPKAVRLAGGAANSPVWVQIFADALQMPVETVSCKEQGILGAAIAAGVGTGVFQSYEDAAGRTAEVKDIVYPREDYREIYEEKYERYQAAAEALAGVWKKFQ